LIDTVFNVTLILFGSCAIKVNQPAIDEGQRGVVYFYNNYVGGDSCKYSDAAADDEFISSMHVECTDEGILSSLGFPRKETKPKSVLIWAAVYIAIDFIWAISALFLEDKIASE
jgi:hypothetical protein